MAEKYDKVRFETARGKFWGNLEKEIIFDFCREGKLLDVGCGTGRITTEAKKRGFDVFAMDPSSEMIKQAKSKCPSVRYVKGDARQTPFKANSFDCITIFRILLHFKTHKKILNETYRILRNDGRLTFDISNRFFYGRLIKIRSNSEVYYFSKRQVEQEIKDVGFKIVKSIHFRTFLPASLLAQFETSSKYLKMTEKIMSNSPFKVFADSFIFYLKK